MHAALKARGLNAVAHITGGGLDNLPRVLPKNTQGAIKSWPVPAPFLEVKKRSGLAWSSLLTTLNCGVGMIWVVQPEAFASLSEVVREHGFKAFDLGVVEKSESEEPSWRLQDKAWEGLDL